MFWCLSQFQCPSFYITIAVVAGRPVYRMNIIPLMAQADHLGWSGKVRWVWLWQYSHYSNAQTLSKRRKKLSLNFARKCVRNLITQDMFPLNRIRFNTRRPEKNHVLFAKTNRFGHSAIAYMSRLLNKSSK